MKFEDLIKFALTLILSILANISFAQINLFSVIQQGRSYSEIGTSNQTGEIRYTHDFKNEPLGIGVEYTNIYKNIGIGGIYQVQVKIVQNTTINEHPNQNGAFTSTDDLQHISFYHLYSNYEHRVENNVHLFIGPTYTIADVNSHGRFTSYRINNGFGYHYGIKNNLSKNIYLLFLYKNITLRTKDSKLDYKGRINISSFHTGLGYQF